MNILEKIIATKYEELTLLKKQVSPHKMHESALAAEYRPVSFARALAGSATGIIAEFKRKSPSKGFIKEGAQISQIVPGYQQAGAAAVSVLTDSTYFGGSLEDLRQARSLVKLPLLRKDFIIDEYQIGQARCAGADVVLLIASALSPERTGELADYARSLQLEVLLEIHNHKELGHINGSVDVVGVNNRNLSSFVTDTHCSISLSGQIPSEMLKISESGISDPETVRQLRKAGFRGFLMGENFMKQDDPALALSAFIAAV